MITITKQRCEEKYDYAFDFIQYVQQYPAYIWTVERSYTRKIKNQISNDDRIFWFICIYPVSTISVYENLKDFMRLFEMNLYDTSVHSAHHI